MQYRTILFLLILSFIIGCQYFNAFFNAESSFDDAIEEIVKANASLSDRAGVYSYADQPEIPGGAKKNLQTSIKQAWKVIELYTDSADYADDAMFLIGRSNFFLKKYPKSIESFSDLIDNYADSEYWQESWLWLSDSHLANKDTVRALNTLEMASLREFDSENEIKLLTRRGSIAINSNQYEIAISYYRQALSLSDDDYLIVSIHLLLAKSFYETGDYDNALVNASIAYDANEDTELTRLALRRIILSYIAKKDIIYSLKWIEDGRSDFDNISDFGWYELQRGRLFLNRGNWEEAKDQWLRVIEDYPKTNDAGEAAYSISEYFRLETGQYDSAYIYILKIPTSAWANEPKKAAHIKKWKAQLQRVVDLQEAIRNDSLILATADSDSSFYYNPENISFLLQEVQAELEKNETQVAPTVSQTLNRPSTTGSSSNVQEEEGDLEEYLNADSLRSIIDKIRIIKSDSLNFTTRDSIVLDSLTYVSTFIQSKLFKKKKFNFNSIEAVNKNYRESLFKLAELMLVEYEDYLSAQVYYRDYLNLFKNDTTQRDRALFALGFIDWRNGRDPYKIRYFEEILDQYPNSPSAQKVYLVRGVKIVDEKKEEIAKFENKYNIAQNLYYNNQVDSAMNLLAELHGECPTEDEYAKVILMEAFIYKHYWNNVDSLYSRYIILAEDYSKSPHFKLIESEYLAIKEHREYLESLDTVKIVVDSLIDSSSYIEQISDTSVVTEPDSLSILEQAPEEEKIIEPVIEEPKKSEINVKKSDEKKKHDEDID